MKAIGQNFDFRNEKQVAALVNRIQAIAQATRANPKAKGVYEVSVKKYSRPRSNSQNEYYWKVLVGTLGPLYGFSAEEMHEYLKRHYNTVARVNRVAGKMEFFGGSTKELSTEQFSDYCERIRLEHLVEHGVFLPAPGEEVSV